MQQKYCMFLQENPLQEAPQKSEDLKITRKGNENQDKSHITIQKNSHKENY